jgi:hypothetical protein
VHNQEDISKYLYAGDQLPIEQLHMQCLISHLESRPTSLAETLVFQARQEVVLAAPAPNSNLLPWHAFSNDIQFLQRLGHFKLHIAKPSYQHALGITYRR